MTKPFLAVAAFATVVIAVSAAKADTTDVQWRSVVEVEKAGAHCADDPNCFNRYHPATKAVATAKPGDHILFHTRDAFDSELDLGSNADDLASLDLNLVHPMTGPVHIEGAVRGDVLAVTVVDIEPDEYGYTIIVPGFGFLRDKFTEPFLVNWKLSREGAVSDQMPGVRVPYEAFPGSIGVLPGEPEITEWLEVRAALGSAGGVVLAVLLFVTNFAWIALNNVIAASACARRLGGRASERAWAVGLGLLATAVVATIGLAAAGTVYGVLASGARARETLVPLLVLPAVTPIMLGGTRAFEAALDGVPADGWPWVQLLAAFGVLALVAGTIAFGPLLEED